ncbi:MAG: PAS domain S-box protein [Euryarchaeota archaeon]|nr:PAS domain S-box protein [Euryarchaeota archaeon]
MKDEPEIVKELKDEERLGKVFSQPSGFFAAIQMSEEAPHELPDKTIYKGNNGKRMEKNFELGSLEEKYWTIFENYSIAITLADEKERIVSWNKYAEELLNMNEKELFMTSVESLYPPEEWQRIRLENVRRKGIKYRMETKMIRKNQGIFDVEISLCTLRGAEGKIVGSVGIIKDISELKKTERKLIESELRYRTIFENSAVAITLTDENERIISWNRYAENLLGMGKDELYLKPISLLYPMEEWKKIRSENVRQKGMQHHMETKVLKKNSELIDVDLSLSVLKNHEGKVVGSIGVIKDITARKKMERELEYERDLLQSLLDNIPDSIYFKDKSSKFIKVNKAKAEHSNVRSEDMVGKTDFDFLSEDIAMDIHEDDSKVMETGKPIVNKIEKIIDTDAVEHWVSVTKIPRYNKDKEIIGTMGISRDVTEIKRADDEIRESEKKYRNLFETAIDPIVIVNKKGYFSDINQQVTELLRYSKNDLIGKKFDETGILTKESLDRTLNNFAKRMKGDKIPPYEVEVIAKDGEVIYVEINASPLYEDKKIVGDLVIFRDLRERNQRKKVELELVESEKKFRNIFDATSDFLLYLDPNGTIIDINNTATTLGGLEKEKIVGKSLFEIRELFSEEDTKKHMDAIDKVAREERINDYECDLITKNGTEHRFLFSNDCIKEKEEVKGILVRGRDVTQRQRAWDELVKLEERYRVLAETSADGVLTIDPLGQLTYVNPSFEKMCGRRKSQILATLFRNYLSEDSTYFFQQVFIDSRTKGEKVENVELELVHLDGNIVPLEVNMAPLKRNNEFAGMVCTIRDITERRKIEDELKKSERLKTEFMNIAAHELKSPVTPIKGYLDLIISDKDTSDKIKGWAKISLRNAERLLKLVTDILDVSRLDTDTMRFEMEKVSTVEILDEIVEDMRPVIEGKDLKFITNIPRDLPDAMGDRNRLSQVFKNLLVNSIKFTDNGSISVEAEKREGHILIAVKDTGIGISKDELKKIFNKFYQAYTGDDRKNEGTGLGLYICKEIIRKHDGEIWAESKLGEGSQVYIKMPYIHKMVVNLDK